MVMDSFTHPSSREMTMSVTQDPATIAATVTTILMGLGAGVRWAIKTFYRDKVDINASSATNDVITNMREELARLSSTIAELSRINSEVRGERDSLRLEVMHLTWSVNHLRDVVVSILGEEDAAKRLREHGIQVNRPPPPTSDSSST